MKLPRFCDRHGRAAVWLGAFASFLITSSVVEAGGAGGVAAGGVGAAGAASNGGTAAGGGGHGGGAVSSGGHAASGGVANSGGRAQSFGGARTQGSNFATSPSAFGRGAQPAFNGSRGAGQGSAAAAGYRSAGPGLGNTSAYNSANFPAPRVVQPNNAWTDRTPAANQQTAIGQRGLASYQGRGSIASRNNRGTFATRNIPDARDGVGQHNGDRYPHYHNRSYYYNYPYYGYGYNYFPVIGGTGYYGGGSDGLADGYATDGSITNNDAGLDPNSNGYNGQPQMVDNSAHGAGAGGDPALADQGGQQSDNGQAPAAAQPQPQQGTAPTAARGPDSLVEAVQTELTNRGYYKGKVDSMFNDDTKAAIRKFQEDNQLNVTGLLNNSTLTVLGVN